MARITYQQYLDLRSKFSQHPLMPASVSVIVSDANAIASGRRAAFEAEKAGLALDLRYSDRLRPYGGYVSNATLDAKEVEALGFEPEHMTARVEVSYDDCYETPETVLTDGGYAFDSASSRYGWEHHEDETRPTHESVKVDYSGPRERADYRWVTLGEREQKYFFCGNAWDGMSRGVRAQVRHERLLELNTKSAEYVTDWCDDDLKPTNVDVRVYWRGEEVGRASLGGFELDERWRKQELADNVADFILSNALFGEALDEAVKWADDAVTDAQERAAEIVKSIALLPPRSIQAVQDTVKTASVTPMKKEA